jgi:hypothetical protein
MNLVRRIAGAVFLISTLTVVALACPSPDPGIMETPPCGSPEIVLDDPGVAGQLETEAAPDSDELTTIAAKLLTALLLF